MTAPDTHHIFLVPGFFGFASFGKLHYFSHVEETLTDAFKRRGHVVRVHQVYTLPTSSIRQRAARILEMVTRKAHPIPGPIHLIGHSTGGLDARLAVAASTSLPTGVDTSPLEGRLKTVVSVSSPHHGTPLASFFNTLLGRHVLRILAICGVYAMRFGKLPLALLIRVARTVSTLDNALGWRRTLLNELNDQLLAEFSPDVRASLEQFFQGIATDQSLLLQLTPEGADLLNAGTADHPDIRYGCVTTLAPSPGLKTALAQGFDPYAQAIHAIYAALYKITARVPAGLPWLTPAQSRQLAQAYGVALNPHANDGIVPTASQLWGELIHAARGDHLDVVGHFKGSDPERAHADWLATGSRFDRAAFERLWDAVAAFILDDS